jgi:hypothetical protein
MTMGISQTSQGDMPKDNAWYATVGEVELSVVAKSAGSREPVFTSMDVLLYRLLLYDGRFLKRKKGP